MQTVGIIGGAGFIGSYVTKQFLENGFRVKVSATNISNQERYAHLSALKNAENMELAPLDVQNLDQLKAFAAGCDILVHGGTPFQLDVEDPQRDLFDPTVKGTENFLEAVSGSPTVKKVVFVASIAAHNTNFPLPAEGRSPDHVYTEKDEPFISSESLPYSQAKYHADQVVRKYVEKHADLGFEIVTISPVTVIGPQLSARQDSTSMGLQHLIKHKIAPSPLIEMLYSIDAEFALVDVADVADAIFKAATISGLHGKHYLASSESWRISEMSLMLNGRPPMGQPRVTVSGALATQELGVHFKPASVPLKMYS